LVSRVNGLVDIHAHLLPGIDDGPEDVAGAVEMARAAAASGVATIAATPHLRGDFPLVRVEEISRLREHLAEEVAAASIALRIVSGAESSLIWALEANDEQLTAATYDQRGKDLLIETPDDVSALDQLLYRIRARGVRVTLAHPERSPAFQREPNRLTRLHEQGVLLQINGDALVARTASPRRRLAEDLCRKGLAHVIASDGHRATEWRPVSSLAAGVEALVALVGEKRAQWMAAGSPAAILEGRPLPEPPDLQPPRRWSWRHRRH
jgi:protein-tyrosine phosphatase